MTSWTFDPADLITAPFGQCPRCEAPEEFGVLEVADDRYMRRCRRCFHTEITLLPPLSKKIIYLDQMAISDMMKAINPREEANQRDRVPEFGSSVEFVGELRLG